LWRMMPCLGGNSMQDSDQLRGPEPRGGGSIDLRAAGQVPLPPHPLDKRWYVHIDGKNYGPYTGHDIRRMVENGQINESDFVCPEGGNAWAAAKSDPLLGSLFRARRDAQPPVTSTVSAAPGGTVVQVTNNVPGNNLNLAAAALLLDGEAANKSPGLALVLSLLICGAGQMYNGQVGKGFLMLIGCVIAWFIFLGWIIWIWSMVDAYQTAKRMNLKYQQRILAGLAG
jgi:TM2 domain-containing membrane protein YozV